jgi:uncharacterized protein
MSISVNPQRLHVVDALRGFAIVAIMLLHNLEHFDVYFIPAGLPSWMVGLDKVIWDVTFFLFASKSYSIFALLFGLTFFIQLNNQVKKGNDFRSRFAWRMLLLLVFGIINTSFYQGDILSIYAVLGIFLIPVAKFSNKVVFVLALILFLQPIELVNLFHALQYPDIKLSNPDSWTYFGNMDTYIKGDSFMKTMNGNLTNGKLAVLTWNYENGRFFTILSLFMLGMLAGRKNIFSTSDKNLMLWKKVLIYSTVTLIPLLLIQYNTSNFTSSKAVLRSFDTLIASWSNFVFMLVLVSGFVLLFYTKAFNWILNKLSPMGKMSLSNYIIQSIIGSTLYYGFGLGLYQYTGATYSLFIGLFFATLLGIFSTYWMSNHKHGPLEYLWHKATWINSKKTSSYLKLYFK